ncbi:hypothetical protein [Denitromonas iodatirespirans]|uniref:Uncharacterized protein n=1 Tax=Denitromonas iodatirespirans TaxID=2795389 RepID=A0A944H8X9_DENI1|nr:hypothetical protein [Denitromonas iodatirespirans]MBT0962679.1 hypothetical protein [Denitromonas iodatirespirans]
MPTRHLLYLDANALSSFRWQQGHIVPTGHYTADEAGIKAFADAVRRTSGGLYTLLVDVVDEGFHADTLPSVHGPDRAAMLQRKRSQTFFGTPLSGALSIGHDRSGRRHDEHFLFLALTRPAIVEPWLQVLRVAHAPLTGIHTVALLLDRLVQRLAAPAERCLLVTLTPAGMRQTFIDQGHLRFSRLAPGLHDIDADTASRCAGEILKTHSYLVSQRMLPRNSPLPVYLLCDATAYRHLAPTLDRADERRYLHVELAPLAQRIGLQSPLKGSDALPLLLHWMARESGLLQLAPAIERRAFRLWQTRQAIVGTGVAVFAAALLFAGKLWYETASVKADTMQLRINTVTLQAHLSRLQAEQPPLPVSLDDLRRALEGFDQLHSHSASPRPWLAHLSAALDAQPDLTLTRIHWQSEEGRRSGDAQLSLPVAMASDRRAMVDLAERFLADLARPPATTARVTRMPVELQSDRAFRSSTTADTSAPVLEVSYSLQAEP